MVKAGKEFQQQVSGVASYSPPFCVSPGEWGLAVHSRELSPAGLWLVAAPRVGVVREQSQEGSLRSGRVQSEQL